MRRVPTWPRRNGSMRLIDAWSARVGRMVIRLPRFTEQRSKGSQAIKPRTTPSLNTIRRECAQRRRSPAG